MRGPIAAPNNPFRRLLSTLRGSTDRTRLQPQWPLAASDATRPEIRRQPAPQPLGENRFPSVRPG